jgi:hypothetical protein
LVKVLINGSKYPQQLRQQRVFMIFILLLKVMGEKKEVLLILTGYNLSSLRNSAGPEAA